MNNKIYEVVIEKLDHQGRGIAFVENKVTFVENSLPGEIVKIKLTLTKKKFNEASVVEYVKNISTRINPICQYFGICGGCDLMHMSYQEQTNFKEKKVKEILVRFSKIDGIESKVEKIIVSQEELNYRNKITLKVNNQIGYYERKSNNIIPISYCYLANEKINEVIKLVNEKLDLDNISELMIRSVDNCEAMLTITLQNDRNIDFFIEEALKNNVYVTKNINNNLYFTSNKSNIIAKIGNFSFFVSPNSFFQINTKQVENLYDKVVEYATLEANDTVLDLYCGTGTIGIYLSNKCKNVLGVEINEDAVEDAKKNAELNNVCNIDFIAIDTSNILKHIEFKPTVIVVDPPRSGLTDILIKDIIEINPNKIIYVSCDPSTLARDLNLLSTIYDVLAVTPVDMFPNTCHVECVVLLQRKNL